MTLRPVPLSPSDRVAILSPASAINPDYVAGAADALRARGYEPVIMAHTLGCSGSYSSPASDRLADLTAAMTDPSIRAIVCSRGGYGAVHLLESLSRLPLRDDPKWLVGFSDISALHALMASKGIMSVHASMTRHLAQNPHSQAADALFDILEGRDVTLRWEAAPEVPNHPGEATGTLIGGNMAVIEGLAGTPFDIYRPDAILFIEDVGEPIYKIERMLYRLRLSGTLSRLRGLIAGRFTDYSPDRNYSSMEAMIADMTADLNIPIAFNAPIGHIGDDNQPILYNSTARLTVTSSAATLKSIFHL